LLSDHGSTINPAALADAVCQIKSWLLHFNFLRSDPAFKLACGRLPDTGDDLRSQPVISRWENAPTLKEIVRLTYALVDI
jgi:hypothetical protein